MIYRLGEASPVLASDVWIADNATVVGKVELAERSSVWFNAVIRGDMEPIKIGAKTNVQDCAVLHTDWGMPLELGEGVTVGHHAMLHGCTIADYALIGINAVVLNGAKIGEHSIIGANALVTEKSEIPPRTLALGSPAKVVRELDDSVIALLHESAEHYVENARRYADQLVAIND